VCPDDESKKLAGKEEWNKKFEKFCGVVKARDTSTKPTVAGSIPAGGQKLP